MKKRILIILALLLTTGCTCEYNLTIDGNTYKEEIIILGETSNEISNFENEWKIPVDKEEYEISSSSDTEYIPEGNIYKYNLFSNQIKFNYDFSNNNYNKSTAVYNCYNKLTLVNHNNSLVLSTSQKNSCFEKYPTINTLQINIKVDRKVISNNADSINGNTYTWNITKENANNKSINLVMEDNIKEIIDNEPLDEKPSKEKKNDYTLYIFLIIILIIIYLGYKWFLKFKEKNNNID